MEAHEFRLYPKGINVIQKYITTNRIALRRWVSCIYSFVTDECSRKRLLTEYKNGTYGEVIRETLEEWVEKQDSDATFGELIKILKDQELNYLCRMLLENLEAIKNAQLTCKAVIINNNIVNFWFGVTDVPNFVGRVEDLKTLHKLVTENRVDEHSAVALLTRVHGFGGIGKTTLARMYAWKYGNYFDGNVIFIDAKNFSSMQNAFQKVAEKLNLEVGKANLNLNHLTDSVYNTFVNSKCLFIFDNAEDFSGQDGVEQFLPSGIIRKPYLLLTSRRKDCFPTKRILPLGVLSQLDSVKLIKEWIPGASDEIADKLAMRLERVPLAIHQAIAHIKQSVPTYRLTEGTYVFKEMDSFLEEYESNQNTILESQFICEDGYAKNISAICDKSLRKIALEEGGEPAKHMLRYISFLNPDDIQLDFLLNLDYQFERVQDNLKRIKSLRAGKHKSPNMMVDLLWSYSLIDINATEMTIKVRRLVQDATRLMLGQEEELLYVKRLLLYLNKLEYSESISHWISIQRSCRFEASKFHVQGEIPVPIELLQPVFSLGLNNALSKNLTNAVSEHGFDLIKSVSRILERMNCDNINKSVETYLGVYNKIESVLGKTRNSFCLTNYVVFVDFFFSNSHKNILRSAIECSSILWLRRFPRAFLLNLVLNNFKSEDTQIFLAIISQSGIDEIFSRYPDNYEKYDTSLFDSAFQIPASLSNEFPCLNYLKMSSLFTNIHELQALNLSWDYRNSAIWPLLSRLEFNLEAVRSAIANIYNTGCTIVEYIQNYKTIFEAEEYNKPDIIVQIINANYFIGSKEDYRLALYCCLRPEFDSQKIEYILTVNNCSFNYFHLYKLNDFGIVTRKETDIYFMKSYIQVVLRKSVLSLEKKAWAVKALHNACVKSRNGDLLVDYDELVKDWHNLLEQEDLKQIAINANLSLADHANADM